MSLTTTKKQPIYVLSDFNDFLRMLGNNTLVLNSSGHINIKPMIKYSPSELLEYKKNLLRAVFCLVYETIMVDQIKITSWNFKFLHGEIYVELNSSGKTTYFSTVSEILDRFVGKNGEKIFCDIQLKNTILTQLLTTLQMMCPSAYSCCTPTTVTREDINTFLSSGALPNSANTNTTATTTATAYPISLASRFSPPPLAPWLDSEDNFLKNCLAPSITRTTTFNSQEITKKPILPIKQVSKLPFFVNTPSRIKYKITPIFIDETKVKAFFEEEINKTLINVGDGEKRASYATAILDEIVPKVITYHQYHCTDKIPMKDLSQIINEAENLDKDQKTLLIQKIFLATDYSFVLSTTHQGYHQ